MTNPTASTSATAVRQRLGFVAVAAATLVLASLGLAGQIDPTEAIGSIFIFH